MNVLFALNLWSPHHGLSIGVAILTAFALGAVHGVTPDEHSWPITFSYALGSFSARRGMRSAMAFSLSFTVQRALLSELAYLGMLAIAANPTWNALVYVVVGAVMVLAAFYVLRFRCALHLHLWPPSVGGCHRPSHADTAEWAGRIPSPAMAAVHGFVAGWGLGAFALIMATVLAPAMPSAALGWVPGAAFGLGTTAVLVLVGAVIGSLIRHQRLPERLAQRVAQEGAGWTLLVGGALFVIAGAAGLAVPSIMTAGISTGIHVHNLDQINVGTLLVGLVVVVAVVTITRTIHRLRHPGPDDATGPGGPALAMQSRPACGEEHASAVGAAPAPTDARAWTGAEPPRRLVLLGPPGAGKTTQARRLAARLGVVYLDAGSLLRQEVPAAGRLGTALAPEQGEVAPDQLVAELVPSRLGEATEGGGYVLDGFPHDLAGTEALAAPGPGDLTPQVAIVLQVDRFECRRRLLARASRERPSDDTPETIERRLAAYDNDIAPVLDYYRRGGILLGIDGVGPPEAVTERILASLWVR